MDDAAVMMNSFPENWKAHLPDRRLERTDMLALDTFVAVERQKGTVYPPEKNVWTALELCPFEQVRVVLLGQDPYHGPGQAHGLCFSVSQGVRKPPSLLNIFKELNRDVGCATPSQGDLTSWSKQGVLLLNTVMTVRAGEPGSHQKRGWEALTDDLIKIVQEKRHRVVFMLWGAHAQSKETLIGGRHLILKAPHPSPLSAHRGFLGCGHFRAANDWLVQHHEAPIDWCSVVV